jgi:glycosyltransferase involved in cell wall biosynthesis
MNPLISVVIPSYNHSQFIKSAIESVLNQSFNNFEIIVIDDGSKDDSIEIIKSIKDKRLSLISQENQGAHNAINRGLSLSKGKYLTILNSDDEYLPTRLEVGVSNLDKYPDIGFLATWIEVIDSHGKILGIKQAWTNMTPWVIPKYGESLENLNQFSLNLAASNFISTTSNFVFRKELFNKLKGFYPLRFAHDWDFFLRASTINSGILVSEPLLKYRVHSNNTIKKDPAEMMFEVYWVLIGNIAQLRNKILNFASPLQHFEFNDWLVKLLNSFDDDEILIKLLLLSQNQYNDQNKNYWMDLLNPGNLMRENCICILKKK